jgi:hypothetical protein
MKLRRVKPGRGRARALIRQRIMEEVVALGIIDRAHLAKRVREQQWNTLNPHEVKFIADLLERKIKNPPHRPKSSDAELLRYELVQAYVGLRRRYPRWPRKKVIGEVSEFFEVTPEYVYKALHEIEAGRLEVLNEIVDHMLEVNRTTDFDS